MILPNHVKIKRKVGGVQKYWDLFLLVKYVKNQTIQSYDSF